MFDAQLLFSYKQNPGSGGDSTNILALGREVAAGTPLYLEVVTPPVTGGGSMTVAIVESDTEDFSTNDTLVTYTVAAEALAKGGTVHCAAIPPWTRGFLKLTYAVTGTATGLSVTAGLTTSSQTAHPQGRAEELTNG